MRALLTRRGLIGSVGAGAGLLLSGCDRINGSSAVQKVLKLGKGASCGIQRLIADRAALAPEFSAAQMSPVFRTNGDDDPQHDPYLKHVGEHFATWRLKVDGMVAHPMALPLAQIRAAPYPDHAARLRGRVERDRAMDGPAARNAAPSGGAIVQRAFRGVPLRGWL